MSVPVFPGNQDFFRRPAQGPVEETAARAEVAADPAPPEQSAYEAGYHHDRHGVAEKRELPAEPDCDDDNRRKYPLQRASPRDFFRKFA